MYIDGQWKAASNGRTFTTVNPANGNPVSTLPFATTADVEQACASARDAFESGVWSGMNPEERADRLLNVARIMKTRLQEMAEFEAMESGKPIRETTEIDIPLSIWAFEYFANLSREIKGETTRVNSELGQRIFNFIEYEPYGVVAVISPYNYPLHLMTRSLCPALAAGNTCVCKASSFTPSSAAILSEIMEEAGIPKGVVNFISGAGSVCGEALASNKEVNIIAFTGSEEVGRKLLHYSAESPIIKKTVLELGGKGPAIAEPDCDLDLATSMQLEGFTSNQGEVCCALTRLILHEDIYDEFLELLVKKATALKMGDTLDPGTQMGSLISAAHLESVHTHVTNAVAAGAKVLCGGKRFTEPPCDKGSYYEPTILVDVTPDMPCFQEEIFGPVLTVVKYKSQDEAIALANNTRFGLGANIFTEDLRKAYAMAKRIDAGTVWVNTAMYSQMACPFGGNKNSGLGREYGETGLHEYLKVKSHIWLMKK
jgi:acyl-CoA reductase-like NAD-dependent aldehyde dehydrogenase